ncbi:hypothetical protein NEOLEDRAFT_1132509 [Neolentinus lepideus HHB14362 ss-1]|uniref:Calcium uniporter protein, mitochondrial n=1 Tax=Neolentinus lepideus HHB14362 ss-1 TaxID=1314782 RepID=A0A165T213_9AGAM|nr:hypothetical protein NEOLEDRAFT_1132509 [Neolentinus lepideus HHB14362 ss-1]
MNLFTSLRPAFRTRPPLRSRIAIRNYPATPAAQDIENTNASHAKFISEASPTSKWKSKDGIDKGGIQSAGENFDTLTEDKGKLSPTSSHLFKLIIPLCRVYSKPNAKPSPPTVFLLHPSQPLSHASRLITASLSPNMHEVSFRSRSNQGQSFQWSHATDMGDFIRDAAREAEFEICISNTAASRTSPSSKEKGAEANEETVIQVEVPTFADRTRFLRRRLDVITHELDRMEGLKKECDREARRGARRVALGGFGMLVVYWGAVARLTFWDYGWDVMEPITYLSGLSTVVLGYLWFLFQGREVSYSSVLHQSISARRDALYKSRGFDIDRWVDLTNEAREVRREIGRIAEDYEDRSAEEAEEEGKGERRKEEAEEEESTGEPVVGMSDEDEGVRSTEKAKKEKL